MKKLLKHKQNYNTLHYIIAELKKYGIKHIIASPGSQNSTFNYIVQEDPFFKCYSVIDERSAVYVALGISQDTKEPVVITCTGATAARNYMSGMTEAYYRNIPIIALTFYNPKLNKYSMLPQYTDRTVSQNDIKAVSIHLPEIKDNDDKIFVLTNTNMAISTAKYISKPVHINCPSAYNYDIKEIPSDIWSSEYIFENYVSEVSNLKGKKIAVYIGEHKKFSEEEANSLSEFASSWDAPVFCDHSSNYHGKNKVLISQFSDLTTSIDKPDLIIDIGGISGIYRKGGIFNRVEYWRISEDCTYKTRHNVPLSKLFIGKEKNIFKELKNDNNPVINYYSLINMQIKKIREPELPLSMPLICQHLAKNIPDNSSLHLAILSAFTSMNFFNLKENIDVSCNVGGFGIDGPVSTAVGQSLANKNKKIFCLTGDLAFFYDMNALGIRHIKDNLRIIINNNNKGVLFRLNNLHENGYGEKTDILVAAAGHNRGGAKGWVESCGFKYLSARTKYEFEAQIENFCNKDYNQPVVFEIFTTTDDEKKGINTMLHKNTLSIANKVSLIQKVFSVKNEMSSNKKYKIIRILGTKIKIRKH